MGSVPLTLPADFNTELNGKQDGMPANLQIDSSSKGIGQRYKMPAFFYIFQYIFCIYYVINNMHHVAPSMCYVVPNINPPLKDGFLGSFRLESQMYCSLAQGAVLNGMFFALGLYFSSPDGVIGPAWPDIPGAPGRCHRPGGGGVIISHVFYNLLFYFILLYFLDP